MKRKLQYLSVLLICGGLLAALSVPAMTSSAQAAESVVPYVQRMLRHYRDHQDPSAEVIQESLEKIAGLDPKAGKLWEKVMAHWAEFNQADIPEVLPDGLPEDDSLCIVVLGFELNKDGTMKEELVARLEATLESAEKYPNAYIAVTGGGTAAYSSNTEAGTMADWLRRHGVSKDRILVEDKAMSTTYNAVNTYAMLVKDYPSVKNIAIVTSDYHIPWGCTMFQTVCDYTEVYGETVIPVVAWAANGTDTEMNTMGYQVNGICDITGIPRVK